MSSRKRSLYSEDRGDRKRYKESKHDGEKLKKQVTKLNQEVQKLKHVKTLNEDARDFLAHSPTKGKEVNVMQCWRCKRYGHRTGDRECPFFIKGNQELEQFRVAHEDPMYNMIRENKKNVKETRIQQLQQLLQDATSSSDSSSSSSSTSESKKRKHKKNKEKKKKKKHHKSSKTSDCSESD